MNRDALSARRGTILLVPTRRQVRILTRAGRRYGIDPSILYGVWGAESNFGRNHNTSGAGAVGPFQFLPSTASGLGVNPYRFRSAAFGAAKYLSQYKGRGVKGMLAAYNAGPAGNPNNPETAAYVPKVLQLARGFPGGGGGSGGGGGGASGPAQVPSGVPGASSLPNGSAGALALLQALQGQQSGPQVASGAPAAPSFSAAPPTPGGALAIPSGGGPAPKPDAMALLSAVQSIGGEVPSTPGASGGGQPGGGGTSAGGGGGGGGGVPWGKVTLGSGADRAGVSTRPVVFRFLKGLAGLAGHSLTIGTGTNHSEMTTSGNVSDHWTGHAADVPASGAQLTRLGRLALIRAGMPRAEARKAQGGIYNLTWKGRRVQVIFNTTEGGNHWNHLHVGISAPR